MVGVHPLVGHVLGHYRVSEPLLDGAGGTAAGGDATAAPERRVGPTPGDARGRGQGRPSTAT
jgi:hypothetical protein